MDTILKSIDFRSFELISCNFDFRTCPTCKIYILKILNLKCLLSNFSNVVKTMKLIFYGWKDFVPSKKIDKHACSYWHGFLIKLMKHQTSQFLVALQNQCFCYFFQNYSVLVKEIFLRGILNFFFVKTEFDSYYMDLNIKILKKL